MNVVRHLSLALALGCLATLAAQEPLRVEYFLDTDPSYGAGAVLTDVRMGPNTLTFDLSAAAAGAHVLYVRSQDSQGRWSPTVARPLFVDSYQDIVCVEYFFDGDDPGRGKATPVALPEQSYKAHFELPLALDVSSLALGGHTLSVRALDRFDQWTDLVTRPFTIVEGGSGPIDPEPQVEADLLRIEYFFDTDPGYGQGIPLSEPRTGTNSYIMDFAGVDAGAHVLYLRAADLAGHWSATIARPLYVMPKANGHITAVEYFFDDADPGEGKATDVAVPENTSAPFTFDIDVDGLAVGDHQLNVRAYDDEGRWSLVSSSPFALTAATGVEWTMPISISAEGAYVVLAGGSRSTDVKVDVYSVSGQRLHACNWPVKQERLALRVPAKTTVIVRATDRSSGHFILRKLTMSR